MPENRLPAIADKAVWEKIRKGRAGIGWDDVVDKIWKAFKGRPRRGTVYEEFDGYAITQVKERIEERERLALRNKVKEEKHLEKYGGVEGRYWGMKTYLHGPMDHAKKMKLRFRVGNLNLLERRKRYTKSREEEDVVAHMCPCGTIESRIHIVGECEIYKEERDMLQEEMRKVDVFDMEEFGRLESSEKTIVVLGDRWWPQTAKQDGHRICQHFLCNIWKKKRNERPNVGGISIKSTNGGPSRKGCVVNGQMTKASNE